VTKTFSGIMFCRSDFI